MKTAFVGVIAASVLLVGCGSLLPKSAPLPALHDFGPPPASLPAVSGFPVTASVTAPAWLDGAEIHYRLVYSDATRVRAYADNRWVAPPAALLQARLQTVFGNDVSGANTSVRAYRLSVRLLDFEQVFANPQAADMQLRVVAKLQDLSSGALLAQHVFSLTQRATPDIGGAVQSASQAANTLIAELVQWVQESVRTSAPPSAGVSRLH